MVSDFLESKLTVTQSRREVTEKETGVTMMMTPSTSTQKMLLKRKKPKSKNRRKRESSLMTTSPTLVSLLTLELKRKLSVLMVLLLERSSRSRLRLESKLLPRRRTTTSLVLFTPISETLLELKRKKPKHSPEVDVEEAEVAVEEVEEDSMTRESQRIRLQPMLRPKRMERNLMLPSQEEEAVAEEAEVVTASKEIAQEVVVEEVDSALKEPKEIVQLEVDVVVEEAEPRMVIVQPEVVKEVDQEVEREVTPEAEEST
jgi:hypothetical protein